VAKRIVVNAGVTETRLAVQDGNLLTELYVERADRRSIVGNIYKGVVTNVLPGMQAAFVDIGLAKDAFLYAGDYTPNLGPPEATPPNAPSAEDASADIDVGDAADAPEAEGLAEPRREAIGPIEEMLRKGQEVLVQVSKEPLGTKGARVTSFVSIPGRYIVYMPQTRHVGVSRRIHDDAERDRLRAIVRDAVIAPNNSIRLDMFNSKFRCDARRVKMELCAVGIEANLHEHFPDQASQL